jgi:hypothetical protein
MSFFDTTKPEKSKSNFRKVEHLDLTPGQTTIRILDTPDQACKYHTHYVKGVYLKCLGEDCPICRSNTKIYAENPDSYREVPGWSPRQERYAVNVLDKTIVKICGNCKAEVKKIGNTFPAFCTKCNQPIVESPEVPLNKVKVLSKGVTVADLLNGIDASVQDKNGEKIGINNFDLVLYVTGTGRQQTISPIPLTDKTDPVTIAPEEKFDLTKICIELTPEEILDLQKGISLKDIFAARKSEAISKDLLESAPVSASIQADIDKLLK